MAVTGQQVVDAVRAHLGAPYVYGAAGPDSFDCSGLVQYAMKSLGINAPRTSEAQWGWVQKISQSALQPGDRIFEQWPGDNAPPGHVVIYAGGGKVLEAPHSGANVQLRSWSPSETTIVGYGRAPGMAAAPGAQNAGLNIPGLGSIGSIPGSITDAFASAERLLTAMMWFLNPENWVRMIAGVVALVLMIGGLVMLAGAA